MYPWITLTAKWMFFYGYHCKDLMEQLLKGVEAIHNNNIIHRDLKPSNVLVSPDGKLKISDFGLSRPFYTGKLLSTQVSFCFSLTVHFTHHKTMPTFVDWILSCCHLSKTLYIFKGGDHLLSGTRASVIDGFIFISSWYVECGLYICWNVFKMVRQHWQMFKYSYNIKRSITRFVCSEK